MSANTAVSPQAAAVAASWAAAAAASSPVPPTPPGVQQLVLTPPPARSIIDQQIAEVEERLDRRISQLMTEMNSWSAQLSERLDKLLGSTSSAAAAAPPDAAAAATPMALPGQAPRLDPWAQSRAGAPEAQLQSYSSELPEVASGIGAPLRAPNPKEVEKPTVYDGNASAWRLWKVSFQRFVRRNDDRWPALLEAI